MSRGASKPNLRALRSEASAALKSASRSCRLATKEAKLVGKAGCESLKAHELRTAAKHCAEVDAAALKVRDAYVRARPAETPARADARTRRAEAVEQVRRDAVARVVDEHAVPERVAELAVRAVERRGKLGELPGRWKRIAERVTETGIAEAWTRYERETGQRRPRVVDPSRKRKKKAPTPVQRKRRAAPIRRRLAGRRGPDVVIMFEDDF